MTETTGKYQRVNCESPIEEMLASAIVEVIDEGDSDLTLAAQWAVGPYRVDLVLQDRRGPVLVIECDGHEFHDRTKEQAARDRRRDREILEMMGLITVRFTGREIWHEAGSCASYCVSMAEQISYLKSLESAGLQAASNEHHAGAA